MEGTGSRLPFSVQSSFERYDSSFVYYSIVVVVKK